MLLFDFYDPQCLQPWYVLDDGVMGGVSRGTLRANSDAGLIFSGKVSLENNGGFSSIRAQFSPINLSHFTGIQAWLRGDGKRYGFYLKHDTSPIVFQANFNTTAGEWQNVQIPFAALRPNWYGRRLPTGSLNLSHLNAMSFIIGDKQAGQFRLDIASVSAYTAVHHV